MKLWHFKVVNTCLFVGTDGLTLNKASSIKKGCYACQCLDNVNMLRMQNLIKIYHVVQEFCASIFH